MRNQFIKTAIRNEEFCCKSVNKKEIKIVGESRSISGIVVRMKEAERRVRDQDI